MPGVETEITDEQIRERAYEISLSPDAGTDEENWLRAEHELRNEVTTAKKKPAARATATQAS